MLRFKLKWLFILIALLAIGLAANARYRNAIVEATRIESQLDAVLLEIYPTFKTKLIERFEEQAINFPIYAKFREKYPPNELDNMYLSGSFGGIGSGTSSSGPTDRRRHIVFHYLSDPKTDFGIGQPKIETKLRITIDNYVPWFFFSGSSKITILDHSAPENRMYLKLLKEKLDSLELECEIRNGPSSPAE